MKKIKLLLATALILCGAGAWAQTDVTSTYITNADFASTSGWTQEHSSSYWSLGNGLIGTYAVANSKTSTTDAEHLDSEYCLGMQCRWSSSYANFAQTKSSATLPAGVYTITYDVQNKNSSTSATYNNKFFVQVGETKYNDTKTEWMSGSSNWTTHTISFSIETDATEDFTISLGYGTGSNNFESSKTPHLYVSHLLMTHINFIRPTSIALNKSSLSLTTGSTSALSVTYTPADVNKDTEITWTSSDETVATVSSAGVVTALKAGSTIITATTANDKSITCTVTVADAAAPATYSSIGEGNFYILNVATGKFLGGANSWGTQASLIDHGIPFTIAESDGTYTLDSHTYNNASQHFLTGTYVDGSTTNLYISSLGSGKYSISTAASSAYLTAIAGSTVVDNSADATSNTLAQWYFISKEDRDALLSSATDASPVEATHYIPNASFSRNMNTEYNENKWSVTASNSNLASTANCAESYQSTFTVTQTISVPNGKYTFRAQGFHTKDTRNPYFFIGEETIPFPIRTGSEASMDAAGASFLAGSYFTDYATVFVTDKSLTLGCKLEEGTDDWCIWDNFELRYHGPTIGGEATEIEIDSETAMTAGSWYYIDIPVTGLYNLTTTTLSNIVYTTDGTILLENESGVTDKFSKAENETLAAGRYFIKSSTAQNLEVTVGAYSYAVGSPTFSTVDGGYTQGSTFTVTFPSAATNDPDAEPAFVALSSGSVNGNSVSLSSVTNGFSLDLGSLTANTDYRIVIPADVYGYSGESMNEAIDITIHTPGVFDGLYFLRTSDGKYLGRGSSYNTRAIAEDFGLPLSVATDATGVTQFTFVDNNLKLFLNESGNGYTDNTSPADWRLQSTTGGFYIVHNNTGSYKDFKLGIDGSKNIQAYESTGEVWTLEPVSEHNTYMEALKDAQAATAAAATGNDAITTKADLATWLETNYNAVSITVPSVSFTEKWNDKASAEWGAGKDMYSNTISSLPEGLYKLTVNAFYRINGSATAADGARGNTYLYGGSAKTQLYSLKDFPAAEAWSGRNQSDAAGYYPDDETSGTAATASSYLTELYVYHAGGDFTYGIHQPSRFTNEEWFGYRNFTLTRYEININEGINYTPVNAAGIVNLTRTIKADKWNTFVVPFNITNDELKAAFGEDVAVAEFSDGGASADAVTVSFTKMATPAITANTPVLLKTSTGGTSYTFNGRTVVAGTPAVEGTYLDFVGTYAASTDIASGDFFISGNGLYKSSGSTTIQGTRAYLQAKGGAPVKVMLFIDDTETSIDEIDGIEAENGVIYNLAGQRISKMQKGINIVNGKKVAVK